MKNKIRKTMLMIIGSLLILANVAYAGTGNSSYAQVYQAQSGIGPWANMNDYISYIGTNEQSNGYTVEFDAQRYIQPWGQQETKYWIVQDGYSVSTYATGCVSGDYRAVISSANSYATAYFGLYN